MFERIKCPANACVYGDFQICARGEAKIIERALGGHYMCVGGQV